MDLTFDGTTVHFDDTGGGPALLLLHAFPLNAGMWRPQVEALAGEVRVVTLDFPGFGRSPALPRPLSIDLCARAALAVLDAQGIERAVVAGLSMGGYVALSLEAQAPARVAGLALCDTRAGADSEEARKGREASALAVEAQGPAVLVPKMLPALLSATASDAARTEVERMIRETPAAGAAAGLRALAGRADHMPRLGSIRCPTLVVCGAADTLTPPSESRVMVAAIEGATYVELPGAGHLSNLERPEDFTRALRGLMQRAR